MCSVTCSLDIVNHSLNWAWSRGLTCSKTDSTEGGSGGWCFWSAVGGGQRHRARGGHKACRCSPLRSSLMTLQSRGSVVETKGTVLGRESVVGGGTSCVIPSNTVCSCTCIRPGQTLECCHAQHTKKEIMFCNMRRDPTEVRPHQCYVEANLRPIAELSSCWAQQAAHMMHTGEVHRLLPARRHCRYRLRLALRD